jgi:hypothetical protein
MSEKPTFEELRNRLLADFDHFGGKLPERNALAWYGYLAALIEWGLIDVSTHSRLCNILPKTEDNPSATILLGRPDPREA